MKEVLEKELKNEKIMRIVWIVSLIVCVLSCIVAHPACIFLGTLFAVICTVVYFARYFQVARHIRWLQKNGLEHIGDDIPLAEPTLPGSKFYCGSRAFFIGKPRVIIPYSQVAWIYKHVTTMYGFITVAEEYYIYCRNGKKITCKAEGYEIQWLIEQHIAANSRDVILGYNSQNAKRYKELRKAYKNEQRAAH